MQTRSNLPLLPLSPQRSAYTNLRPGQRLGAFSEAILQPSELTEKISPARKISLARLLLPRGFTLMEVMVTLGIFAMFVGVMGLFPQLMNVSADASIETRSAHIAQQVIRELMPSLATLPAVAPQSTNPDGHPPTNAPYGNIVRQISTEEGKVDIVDLRESGVYSAHYDLNGQPVPASDADARLLVEVEITPQTDREGFCQVEVRVRSMSAAASSPSHRFVTKVAFPRKEKETS